MSHDKPGVHDDRFTCKCHPAHCLGNNMLLVTTLTGMMKSLHPLSRRLRRPETARVIVEPAALSDRHSGKGKKTVL